MSELEEMTLTELREIAKEQNIKNVSKLKKEELKGTLRISHMIPVPKSELILYDLENEKDNTYKDLVRMLRQRNINGL